MIGTYLSELSASMGFASPPSEESDDVELDLVKSVGVFALVKFFDGFGVFSIDSKSWAFLKRNFEAVKSVKVLAPSVVAFTLISAPSAVHFMNPSGEVFHVIRLTGPVVSIQANSETVAIIADAVHLYDANSLEEKTAIETARNFVLSDRLAAYSGPGGAAVTQSLASTLTTISQDAFDNLVIAAGMPSPMVSSPTNSQPTTRIFVYDTILESVVSVIDNASSRSVECLGWSVCGTRLFVCAGNGHSVQVYGETFRLLFQLNRGVTPAVVKSLSGFGDRTVILTAKKTGHIFDREKCTAKLRETDSVLVVNNAVYHVSKNKVFQNDLSIEMGEGSLDSEWLKKITVNSKSQDQTPTCHLPQVPLWMSPLLSFNETRFATPIRDPNGSLIGAMSNKGQPGNPQIIEALSKPLNPKTKYNVSNGQEGFVHVKVA